VRTYLDTWATKGVYGHFTPLSDSSLPTFIDADEAAAAAMAPMVGARESEVVVMGNLTSNLHTLMASFYRPTKERWRIVIEGKAFPSDHVSRALDTG
jgi:kynureninase